MSVGAREVELKFLCAPEDLDRALAAAPSGRDETRRLVSTYFDTAKGDLRKAGVSLRVREDGGARVLTLKRGQGVEREEHEAPLDADAPDLAIGPLRELLSDTAHRSLSPAFRVEVTRHQRLVEFQDAEIELAADRGGIRNGDSTATICELELELKSGAPRALFALAGRLVGVAPLYLSFEGKAAQGQALLDGTALAARRKGELRLDPDATCGQVFQAWARDCVSQITANATVLRRADTPEAVHQLRVAARRLRSALSTFEPVLPERGATAFGEALKWLAGACDDARNLDVYQAETIQPALRCDAVLRGLNRLGEALSAARGEAYGKVLAAVSSPRFRTLVLDLTAWIETGAWRESPAAARSGRDFAADALDRSRRKLCKRGRDLKAADDEARHKARIQAKRLRYAIEGFAPLFDGKAVARFVDPLRRLQDQLGGLNDIATAQTVIADLALEPAAAYAAGHLAGERSAQRPRLIRRAAKALGRLAAVEPFWRP